MIFDELGYLGTNFRKRRIVGGPGFGEQVRTRSSIADRDRQMEMGLGTIGFEVGPDILGR